MGTADATDSTDPTDATRSDAELRAALSAAITDGGTGLAAADSLCRACVDLLPIDGAAISLIHHGRSRGTYGSSSELSQRLDAYQFTYGEGPCLDAVRTGTPVLVPDLHQNTSLNNPRTTDPVDAAAGHRWPAFTASLQDSGIHAVFALPVTVASSAVGALDLFSRASGPLAPEALRGALFAAHLAALPVLGLMGQVAERAAAGIVEGEQEDPWSELQSLERTEIYQATGMLIAQGDLAAAEALVRLRARAYTTTQTASEVAWEIIERRLVLDPSGSWHHHGGSGPGGSGPGGSDGGDTGLHPSAGDTNTDPHRQPSQTDQEDKL